MAAKKKTKIDTDKCLQKNFDDGLASLVFILQSARAQAERTKTFAEIYATCQSYHIDPTFEYLKDTATKILETYDEMIRRVKDLTLDDFKVDAADMTDPFEDMIPYWTERTYDNMEDVLSDLFVYETIAPCGGKLSQLWEAVHNDMDVAAAKAQNDALAKESKDDTNVSDKS